MAKQELTTHPVRNPPRLISALQTFLTWGSQSKEGSLPNGTDGGVGHRGRFGAGDVPCAPLGRGGGDFGPRVAFVPCATLGFHR